jgi:hypothetical protein
MRLWRIGVAALLVAAAVWATLPQGTLPHVAGLADLQKAFGTTQVKTANYTIAATDSNLVTFNCAAGTVCTATLSTVGSYVSAFAVQIANIGAETVLIASASTINGAKTLLPGMSARITQDGSAWYSMRNTNISLVQDVIGTTDVSLSMPITDNTNASITQHKFANLPVGTIIIQHFQGVYHTSAAGHSYWTILTGTTNPGGTAGTNWGQQDYIPISASQSDSNCTTGGTVGQCYYGWRLDSQTEIRATGATGKQVTSTTGSIWSANAALVATTSYTVGSLQNFDTNIGAGGDYYSPTGQTFDDTIGETLHVVFGYTACGVCNDATGSWIFRAWTMQYVLPWNG